MKRLAALAKMMLVLSCVLVMVGPSWAGFKAEIDDTTHAELGIWMQGWYQWVEDGKGDEDLNDFLIRRAYMYLKGQVTEHVTFFTHLAQDKAGMDVGKDEPKADEVEWRDLWMTVELCPALKVQAGRMYVPLTRNYGTTSTKSMLTTDLSFLQGGSRGGIFYASKTGRDDGVTFWGNTMDDMLQYRFMVSEGVEVTGENPDDNLRFVGRLSLSLLEPETGWFNKGTYLGKKEVLSFGLGFDSQSDLVLGGSKDDNLAWTVDAFLDYPLGDGSITAEAAYIDIEHCTQDLTTKGTDLGPGEDAEDWYISAGYLFPNEIGIGHIQPYFRYENLDVDGAGNDESEFLTLGCNYFMKGHNCKLSVDYTNVDQNSADDYDIITLQLAIGF